MSKRIVCAFWPGGVGTENLTRFTEASMRYTPQAALRADEAVFLDITASRHLLREETLALKFAALAQRLGLPAPRVTIAGGAGAALAQSRWGGTSAEQWPLEALLDFAQPFESMKAEHVGEMISVLRGLGLARVVDFARLPRETIAARLGQEGLELQQRLRGESEPSWPVYRPAERIRESVSLLDAESLDSCGADLEALLFFAKRALDRCFARLHARALRLASFELDLDLERGDPRHWALELAIAQGSTRAVLPILRERLSRDLERAPLEAAVTQLHCEVRETAPGHGAQRDFFCVKEERREARDAFFARLAARLGPDRVFVAAEVDRHPPEAAWKRAHPEDKPTPETRRARRARRPLRLVDPPQPVRVLANVVQLPDGQRHVIAEKIGPERLQAEWWSDRPVARDYFEIVGAQGERLWVFKELDGGPLYLHGYFD